MNNLKASTKPEQSRSQSNKKYQQSTHPCTLESLNKILTHIKPSQLPGTKAIFVERYGIDDYNEVFPNILIGNFSIARNKRELCKLSVTHVLNCAEPSPVHQYLGAVDTSQHYYNDIGITYMGLQIDDTWNFPITSLFDTGTKFIDSALQSKGKVLVNCMMGMSRSSTLVLSYLMRYQGMSLDNALTTVRKKREIHPNIGFLQQLIEYDHQLKRKRNRPTAKQT